MKSFATQQNCIIFFNLSFFFLHEYLSDFLEKSSGILSFVNKNRKQKRKNIKHLEQNKKWRKKWGR